MERYQVVGHLRLDPEGTATSYADAQAQIEALQAKYDDLLGRYQTLVAWYDKHYGTPCEQVRHQQQVEALQRERDELREMTKIVCGHCCEPMAIPSRAILQTHLSALQGLVRALVCTRTYMVDSEYIRTRGGSILYICSNSISAERLGALLAYRATLPATPTERGENHSGDDTDMVQKGGGDGE